MSHYTLWAEGEVRGISEA